MLVSIDPHGDYDFVASTDKNTFRELIDEEGNILPIEGINPDTSKYSLKITLNHGMESETVVHQPHKSLKDYIELAKAGGFKNIQVKELGYQKDMKGVEFPAYQILTAEK